MTGKAHRAIIEIPEGFESSRMDQASMKTLVANDNFLNFRYEGTYGSFSENTWKDHRTRPDYFIINFLATVRPFSG